jgi:hypothetical protein
LGGNLLVVQTHAGDVGNARVDMNTDYDPAPAVDGAAAAAGDRNAWMAVVAEKQRAFGIGHCWKRRCGECPGQDGSWIDGTWKGEWVVRAARQRRASVGRDVSAAAHGSVRYGAECGAWKCDRIDSSSRSWLSNLNMLGRVGAVEEMFVEKKERDRCSRSEVSILEYDKDNPFQGEAVSGVKERRSSRVQRRTHLMVSVGGGGKGVWCIGWDRWVELGRSTDRVCSVLQVGGKVGGERRERCRGEGAA